MANGLGVGPSALYTHVDGLDGLRYLVAVAATNNLTRQVRNAAIGVAGDGALFAVGDAYRRFALGNPGQFAALLLPPPIDDGALRAATGNLLEVLTLVYQSNGLGVDESRLAAGSTHSAIHGFLALEITGGTTPSHDRQYRHLIETIARGVLPPHS